MNSDIIIKTDCFDCNNAFPSEDLFAICDDCFEKRMLVELVQDAMESVSSHSYDWTDKSMYSGFKNDNDLDVYMLGVKRGYSVALFWIAEFFALTEYFEEKIQPRFYIQAEGDEDE